GVQTCALPISMGNSQDRTKINTSIENVTSKIRFMTILDESVKKGVSTLFAPLTPTVVKVLSIFSLFNLSANISKKIYKTISCMLKTFFRLLKRVMDLRGMRWLTLVIGWDGQIIV